MPGRTRHILLCILYILEACGGKPAKNEAPIAYPYATKPSDGGLERGTVTIETISYPANANKDAILIITGALPTACHELRLSFPQVRVESKDFEIEAWSVYDDTRTCAQVPQTFSAQVPVVVTPGKIRVNGLRVNRENGHLP